MFTFGLPHQISPKKVLLGAIRSRAMISIIVLMSIIAIGRLCHTGISALNASAILKWCLITIWLAMLAYFFTTRANEVVTTRPKPATNTSCGSIQYLGIFAAGLLMCIVAWHRGPIDDAPYVDFGGSSTLVGCVGLIGTIFMSGRKSLILAILGAAPFVYLIIYSTTRTAVFGLCIAAPAIMIWTLRHSDGKLSTGRLPQMFARAAAFATLFVAMGLPMLIPNRFYPYYAPAMNDDSIAARSELLTARYGRYMRLLPLSWTTAIESSFPKMKVSDAPTQQTAFQFASNPNAEDRGSLWRRSLPTTPSEWGCGRWPVSFEIVSHLDHCYDYPHNGTIEVLYYFGIVPAVLFGVGTSALGFVMWLRLAAPSSAAERLSAAIVLTQLVQMNVMGTFEDHIAAIVLLAVEVSLLISNSEATKRQELGMESTLTRSPTSTRLRPLNAATNADRLVA